MRDWMPRYIFPDEGENACLPPHRVWNCTVDLLPGQAERQMTSNCHSECKLTPQNTGPFLIEAHVKPITYKLKLPLNMHIHTVFHVSLLKPVIQGVLHGNEVVPSPLGPIDIQSSPAYWIRGLNGAVNFHITYCPRIQEPQSWHTFPPSFIRPRFQT